LLEINVVALLAGRRVVLHLKKRRRAPLSKIAASHATACRDLSIFIHDSA
jgi:hypothetical protein